MMACLAESAEMSTVGMEIVREVPGVGPAKVGASAACSKRLDEIARKQKRDRRDIV
jgi:hypothetical protein